MIKKSGKKSRLAVELTKKLISRKARIGIVGLGYVGLPLSVELTEAGFTVTGFDISEKKVKLLKSGKSDIDDISNATVKEMIDRKQFTATVNPKGLQKMDVVAICVPTPLSKTKDPDVSYILAAVKWIKTYLRKGTLVCLESTTYPGTTEDLILPILEEGGLKVGEDFFLAFSPERVDPGNANYNTKNTPRVVGGITPTCCEVAKIFYEQAIPNVHAVSSTSSAEMVKLLENTFRSVNIALVNEVALMCDRLGLNVWEIIDAAATKPFGFMPFYPGPGLGGHCIPIDPHYLSWKLRSLNYYARFIELAGDINSNMPEYVVRRVSQQLNMRSAKSLNKAKILVLGVAYKRDIQDMRESPAFDVINGLLSSGATVQYNDPYVPKFDLEGKILKSVNLTPSLLKKADLVVIVTDHTCYDYQWITDHANLIFDTRNATRDVSKGRKKIELM